MIKPKTSQSALTSRRFAMARRARRCYGFKKENNNFGGEWVKKFFSFTRIPRIRILKQRDVSTEKAESMMG